MGKCSELLSTNETVTDIVRKINKSEIRVSQRRDHSKRATVSTVCHHRELVRQTQPLFSECQNIVSYDELIEYCAFAQAGS